MRAPAPGRVLETALYAADLSAAERFYGDIVGLERVARVDGRHVFFRCGDSLVLIFNPSASQLPGGGPMQVPSHGAFGPGHVCFAASGPELELWRRRLPEAGVEIEAELRWPNGAESIYVRDPAGNSVEFAQPAIWGLAR